MDLDPGGKIDIDFLLYYVIVYEDYYKKLEDCK